MFVPKLVTTLRGYTREQLIADLTAGVIVGVVALPLAIAFAIASGVTPDRGLWTAIVAGFLISALGGSRVQIGGPTGAFVVIVYGIVQQHGLDGLLVATLLAGIILVAMGAMQFGVAIKFIPRPLIVGFTTGIAAIIFTGQINDLLGLGITPLPAEFVGRIEAYASHLGVLHLPSIGIAIIALALILYWPRLDRKVPGPFVALVFTTLIVWGLDVPVATVGSRFGDFGGGSLPHVAVPQLSFTAIASLVGPALTIAMLAAIESLLSAVVADGMIGSRHRSNMELIAQGVANIGSALVGGIPATGAIARTATNIRNGGRTPIAGITHAVVLLIITLVAGGLVSHIPMPTLAAILVVVAYHMSEWRSFRAELRGPKSDILILLLTFALTVLVDLTVAIGVGVVLASFLFVKRMAEESEIRPVTGDIPIVGEAHLADSAVDAPISNPLEGGDIQAFRVMGALFFGAADRFRDMLGEVSRKPKVLILRLGAVPAIDSSGIHVLQQLAVRSEREKTHLILSELASQPRRTLENAELIGPGKPTYVAKTYEGALALARALVDDAKAERRPSKP